MSKMVQKEEAANIDDILKFLEEEIQTFDALFDELSGVYFICYKFLVKSIFHLIPDQKRHKTDDRNNPARKPVLKPKPTIQAKTKPKLFPKPNLVTIKSKP